MTSTVAPAEGEPAKRAEPDGMIVEPADCHQVAAAFALTS